jgi:hypothetical protein
MGYFKSSETKQIALKDPAYWVKIASELRYGDLKNFAGASATGEIDFVTSADKLLLAVIKEWNLDDEQGNILPITNENIDRLERDDAITIITEAGGLIDSDTQKKTI